MINDKPTSKTIIVSNVFPQPGENAAVILEDLFSYCGEIKNIHTETVNDGSVKAYITFSDDASVKTAIVIHGSSVNNNPIYIENAPADFIPPNLTELPQGSQDPEVNPQIKSMTNVFAQLIAKGYNISSDAVTKAKNYDEQHGFTDKLKDTATSLQTKVGEIDENLGISAKMTEIGGTISSTITAVDQNLGISDKTKQIGDTSYQFLQNVGHTVQTNVQSIGNDIDQFVQSHESLNKGVESIKNFGAMLWGKTEEIGKSINSVINQTQQQVQEHINADQPPQQNNVTLEINENQPLIQENSEN